ncbi:28347f8c-7a5f-42fc-8fc3-3a6e317e8438 [Thermothielavioides terrestris]|uniref:28347f8c-7a5f-42fc-8fc3-3a6e317e8438 n=1 Tax=Thermothielavioides terrestris TaxID=2587410 RepID=A0A3S4F2T7_9PEZI|nr:28347f8c-7a5f-42fc-8fc3-3a6e317e8438 [Thermothielavioides terrestris]
MAAVIGVVVALLLAFFFAGLQDSAFTVLIQQFGVAI